MERTTKWRHDAGLVEWLDRFGIRHEVDGEVVTVETRNGIPEALAEAGHQHVGGDALMEMAR